ncbi:hypothetical protein ZWY2020_017839 [Hordeum vulgare]|nr:hypothetical protein ZWY2020_017839 [Hordeum vulgare]
MGGAVWLGFRAAARVERGGLLLCWCFVEEREGDLAEPAAVLCWSSQPKHDGSYTATEEGASSWLLGRKNAGAGGTVVIAESNDEGGGVAAVGLRSTTRKRKGAARRPPRNRGGHEVGAGQRAVCSNWRRGGARSIWGPKQSTRAARFGVKHSVLRDLKSQTRKA